MNILIVNGYVRENKGDAMQMSVAARQLSAEFPKATIKIGSLEDPRIHPFFEDWENVGSMRLYSGDAMVGRPRRILRKLLVLGVEMCWAKLPRPIRHKLLRISPKGLSGELGAVEHADILVSVGGGYLHGSDSIDGDLHVRSVLLPIKLAKQLVKVVALGPQSFGPFGNDRQRHMVAKVFVGLNLISTREPTSIEVLKNIGLDTTAVVPLIDLAFSSLTTPPHTPSKRRGLHVAITVCRWFDADRQTEYEQAIADFIVQAEKRYKAHITLVPQVTSTYREDDDRIVAKSIYEFATAAGAHPTLLTEELDHHALKALYGEFSLTIGTRFHSVIFSLTSYVPAIAISYNHKASGIMKKLGLEKWVVPIDKVSAKKLEKLFGELIENREQYIQKLKVVLPPNVALSDSFPHLVRQAYDAATDATSLAVSARSK